MNSKRVTQRSKKAMVRAKLVKLLKKPRTRKALLVKATQINQLPAEISDNLRNATNINELGNALADAFDDVKIEIERILELLEEIEELEEDQGDMDFFL